jgi:hypothetical protein
MTFAQVGTSQSSLPVGLRHTIPGKILFAQGTKYSFLHLGKQKGVCRQHSQKYKLISNLRIKVLPPFQTNRSFRFLPSKTVLSSTQFVEKIQQHLQHQFSLLQ